MRVLSGPRAMHRAVEFRSGYHPFHRRVRGRRVGQWMALGLACAPTMAFLSVGAFFVVGMLSRKQAVAGALAAVEVPGLLLLVCTMFCTPLANAVGRPYRVERRAFGIGFSGTGFGNFILFLIEHPARELTLPFAIAASLAVVCVIPLLATSSRKAMRKLGTKAWTRLHRLTYVAALAVVVHLWLVPQDDGPAGNIIATVLIGSALGLRIPGVRCRIIAAQKTRGASLLSFSTWTRSP
jgi:DMSO/TMAO reductase YedYZ heme-binding membrane subunit